MRYWLSGPTFVTLMRDGGYSGTEITGKTLRRDIELFQIEHPITYSDEFIVLQSDMVRPCQDRLYELAAIRVQEALPGFIGIPHK